MKLLLPEFGLLIWTLLAFLIVFFYSREICLAGHCKGIKGQGIRNYGCACDSGTRQGGNGTIEK